MAAFDWTATTAPIAGGTAVKTLLQVTTPANHRVRIKGWSVTGDGTSGTDAQAICYLQRQTTAGTGQSSPAPPSPRKKDDSIAESILCTIAHDFTAEPTGGDILKAGHVHNQNGYEEKLGPGDEYIIGGGDRVGIVIDAAVACNWIAHIACEE